MSKRRNTFSRAIRQLKSEEIDNKIQLTETLPTNNTMGVFISMPPGAVVSTVTVQREVGGLLDLDFDADGESDGTDTTGLFETDGTPSTAMPPNGDTSYILGPMSAMYYSWWSGGTTTIGYIRQSDRKMVNLGTISGTLDQWDGSNVNSYGQLTLEHAVWFRDVKKKDNAGNHPSAANYRAFYPGPPSNSPDAQGRYLCTITGEAKDTTVTQNVEVPHSPTEKGAMSADDNFATMMDRLKKFMANRGKISLDKAKDSVRQILDALPAVGYSADIAASVLQNEPIIYPENQIPKQDAINYLNNIDPSFIGNFIQINNGPVPYSDENIYKDESGKVHSNIGPNGEKAYYQPDNTGTHIKSSAAAQVAATQGVSDKLTAAGNAQLQVYKNPDSGKWMIRYEDHAYHNLNSSDPGEVPDKAKAAASNALHTVSDSQHGRPEGETKFDGGELGVPTTSPDNTSPNTGGMSNYPCNSTACIRGDVQKSFEMELNSNDVPQGIKDAVFKQLDNAINQAKKGKKYGVAGNFEGSDYFNQGISNLNQGLSWGGHGEHDNWGQTWNSAKGKWEYNSYEPSGKILSEAKASRVLKNLKKPVVLPEGKKKSYKVKPGARMRGMDKLVGDIKPQQSYKEPQKIWSKNSQGYNERTSQEKKNQVLQYVGASMDHWDYMTDTVKKQGGKIMSNYKDHDYLYDYWLGGTRKKAVRKEEVKGDYVIFLDDKSSILQSSYNEKVEQEKEKEMFDEYYKLNPKNEPIPYENDPLFKRVTKRLKPVIDYPDKPAKKGYPNEPPPKMVNGWHPEYGKRYKYDKLDPVSAKAMPPTGNPEIDANVEKTKVKPK